MTVYVVSVARDGHVDRVAVCAQDTTAARIVAAVRYPNHTIGDAERKEIA